MFDHPSASALTAGGKIHSLPLHLFGLKAIPGIPIQLLETVDTLGRLLERTAQTSQSVLGLNRTYTLGGQTGTAYDFLFGAPHAAEREAAIRALRERLRGNPESVGRELLQEVLTPGDHHPAAHDGLQALSLDEPEQYAMTWTTFPDVWTAAQPELAGFAGSLTDADTATRQFWPVLAGAGLPYNLVNLERVTGSLANDLRSLFGDGWTARVADLAGNERLFALDLRIFESYVTAVAQGLTRFTPGAVVLLAQDPGTRELAPVAIRISNEGAREVRLYLRTEEDGDASDSAWIYACQAARTAVTVYGIWLGHVYTWHLVPGAMQMTLLNHLPTTHPLRLFLAPSSKYLMPFDNALLLLWPYIAPPTSFADRRHYLELSNRYAEGRSYFDDDPPTRLERQGITEADFSADAPWDRYRLAGLQLELWKAASDYVTAVVDGTYADDAAVATDTGVHAWITAAAAPDEGNLRGLPAMDTKQALADVLTSHVFRILVHGSARQTSAANPDLTFVANFPPCLQQDDLPAPDATLSTGDLLGYLPKTGTLGGMVHFYFTFSFSPPYEPLIPIAGMDTGLAFPGGPEEARNQAQVRFREAVLGFMGRYQEGPVERFQWPLNVET